MPKRRINCSRRLLQYAGADAGVTLTELLVAVCILALVLVPMLDFSAYVYNGQSYERQLAATLATAKLEELENYSYRRPGNANPSNHTGWLPSPIQSEGSDAPDVGPYWFLREWIREDAAAGPEPVKPTSGERPWLRKYTVRVTCINCRQPVSVEVVSYLAKAPGSVAA
jgi:hypothetical protein